MTDQIDLARAMVAGDTAPQDAPYFTTVELRATDPAFNDMTTWPDSVLEEARLFSEEAFEDAAHVAFVTRAHTDTLDGSAAAGDGSVLLTFPRVTAILTVTVNGTPLAGADLASLVIEQTGKLYRSSFQSTGYWGSYPEVGGLGWPLGRGNIAVTYQHGYPSPPLRVKRAVLTLAKHYLIKGPVDDRALQFAGEYGPINLLTPGVRGSVFGIPEVDVVLARYGYVQGVA